jgi:hypothetical protein
VISTNAPALDWYAATVKWSEGDVLDTFTTALCDEHPVPTRPSNGYGHAWELRRSGRRCALVSGGGQHEFPHVVGTGDDAPALARLTRSMPHRVSRVDVCVDTEEGGAYETLRTDLLRVGTAHGTSAREITSPLDASAGRTLYLGSTSSEHMGRLYEKGKQLPAEDRPDWVRWELQVTPKKGRKDWAAVASPLDLLGAAQWARVFAASSLDLDPARPPVHPERVSDLDGALAACAVQYGGRLLELLALYHGDLAACMLDLVTRINGPA